MCQWKPFYCGDFDNDVKKCFDDNVKDFDDNVKDVDDNNIDDNDNDDNDNDDKGGWRFPALMKVLTGRSVEEVHDSDDNGDDIEIGIADKNKTGMMLSSSWWKGVTGLSAP